MNRKQKESALVQRLCRRTTIALLALCAGTLVTPPVIAQTGSSGSLAPGSQPLQMHRILGIVKVMDFPSIFEPVAPLSTGQKFEGFAKTIFDPGTIAVGVLGAAVSAGSKVQPAYGGGGAAFGQKIGAVTAGYASDSLFARALLPALLHQDPRLFRKGTGSAGSRVGYALSRTFVTRTDSGKSTLNTSVLAGYAMSTALSNVYYPDRNRNAGDATVRYAEALGINAAFNVVLEFWKKRL